MYKSNIWVRAVFLEIPKNLRCGSHYFKLLKGENPYRCFHKLPIYWKWTPPLAISSNASKKIFPKKPCKCKQVGSDQIPASVNVLKRYIITLCISRRNEITLKKYKRDVQATLVFDISKPYQKEISKRRRFFVFQKHIKTSTPKLHQFFIEIPSKKYIKTIFRLSTLGRKKYIEMTLIFPPSKLCQKKVRRNDIDFPFIKILSK